MTNIVIIDLNWDQEPDWKGPGNAEEFGFTLTKAIIEQFPTCFIMLYTGSQQKKNDIWPKVMELYEKFDFKRYKNRIKGLIKADQETWGKEAEELARNVIDFIRIFQEEELIIENRSSLYEVKEAVDDTETVGKLIGLIEKYNLPCTEWLLKNLFPNEYIKLTTCPSDWESIKQSISQIIAKVIELKERSFDSTLSKYYDKIKCCKHKLVGTTAYYDNYDIAQRAIEVMPMELEDEVKGLEYGDFVLENVRESILNVTAPDVFAYRIAQQYYSFLNPIYSMKRAWLAVTKKLGIRNSAFYAYSIEIGGKKRYSKLDYWNEEPNRLDEMKNVLEPIENDTEVKKRFSQMVREKNEVKEKPLFLILPCLFDKLLEIFLSRTWRFSQRSEITVDMGEGIQILLTGIGEGVSLQGDEQPETKLLGMFPPACIDRTLKNYGGFNQTEHIPIIIALMNGRGIFKTNIEGKEYELKLSGKKREVTCKRTVEETNQGIGIQYEISIPKATY